MVDPGSRVWFCEWMSTGDGTTIQKRDHSRIRSLGTRIRKRPVTYMLIMAAVIWTACLLVLAPSSGDWRSFGISDGFEVFGGDYWSVFTSIFAHVNPIHLI